jgi:hypothetical protein
MKSIINRLRNKSYCKYKCLDKQFIPPATDIPAIIQNSAIQQLKLQNKGGKPVFRNKISINQFGRPSGTGGQPPSNFR